MENNELLLTTILEVIEGCETIEDCVYESEIWLKSLTDNLNEFSEEVNAIPSVTANEQEDNKFFVSLWIVTEPRHYRGPFINLLDLVLFCERHNGINIVGYSGDDEIVQYTMNIISGKLGDKMDHIANKNEKWKQ